MYSIEYIERFGEESLKLSGRQEKLRPSEAIEGWASLIEQIREGYCFIAPEFYHDLEVSRTGVQLLLESKVLLQFPEHQYFIQEVKTVDEEFRNLSIENPAWAKERYWWHRRLLKKGTEDYLAMLKSFYREIGFEPEVVTHNND